MHFRSRITDRDKIMVLDLVAAGRQSSGSRVGGPDARETDIVSRTGIYAGNSRILIISGTTFRRDRIGYVLSFRRPRNDAAGVVRGDALDTGTSPGDEPNADCQKRDQLTPHHPYPPNYR